jgi:hypothetical protein
MTSIMQNYLTQVQKNLGYRATWEPHRPMKIGTYGKIHQGIFSEYGHIDEFNIPLSIDKLKTTNQLTYKSEEKGSYTLKAKGEINPLFQKITENESGLLLVFKKDNGIVFKIQGITYFTIKNKVELARDLDKLTLSGQWDSSYLIITETLQAEKTAVLLSKKKNSELEIKCDIEMGTEKTKWADFSFFGEIIRSQGMSLQFSTTTMTTPLFKLSRLKAQLLMPEKNRNTMLQLSSELEDIPFDKAEMQSA